MLCFTICFVHVLKNPLIVTLEGMWPILVLNKKCQTNTWTDFAITYTHCSLPHIQHSHLWGHRLLWCYTLLKAKEYWNLKIPSLDLACVWEEGKKTWASKVLLPWSIQNWPFFPASRNLYTTLLWLKHCQNIEDGSSGGDLCLSKMQGKNLTLFS